MDVEKDKKNLFSAKSIAASCRFSKFAVIQPCSGLLKLIVAGS